MVRSKRRKLLDDVITHGLLIVFCAVMIFPVLYTFTTSFKSKQDVLTIPPTFLPPRWTLDGYLQVLKSDLLPVYIPNSAINAVFSTVITVVFSALAGYVFSRYKFKGNRALQLAILGLMMIPGVTNLVAYYRLGSVLHILSTHLIIIAVYSAIQLPFGIWILKNFFDAIPIELEEAALVDGCSGLQALRHIVVPLAMPGVFAAFLLILVDTWNEFLFAVTLLSRNESRTAMIGLYDFQTTFDISYHALAAASIIILLPMVAAFILGRRTFFQAMMEGALKG
jgi:multiple sugar transport system permease protein